MEKDFPNRIVALWFDLDVAVKLGADRNRLRVTLQKGYRPPPHVPFNLHDLTGGKWSSFSPATSIPNRL